MNDFLKMDVFFVVATIALVILTTLLSIALYYTIRLMRTVYRLGTLIEREALRIREDMDEARLMARREAGKLLTLITSARAAVARFLAPSDSHKQ